MSSTRTPCMISFDIEDWFQVENLKGAIRKADWEQHESRVMEGARKILNLLDESRVKATFFILGWVAQRTPSLVKEIHTKGHEVACHGFGHDLVYSVDPKIFRKDIRESKRLLEDITGEAVMGYRAPSFSITEWAIDILREEGFVYDSSIFPASVHDRYGRLSSFDTKRTACVQEVRQGFYEVCIPTLRMGRFNVPWGGGGYFRFLPYPIYIKGVRSILSRYSDFVFYLHPWELDPKQPRVKNIRMLSRFRHYWGLERTERKLRGLLKDFRWIPIRDRLTENGLKLESVLK